MRITVANDQEGQLDNNHRICKTNLVDSYHAAHKKPTRSMRLVVGSIGGLLCALFSLNAAAYTGVCAAGQTHTVVIPMPSILVPPVEGLISVPARVPISFRCINGPIYNMSVSNPNMLDHLPWQIGSELFPSPYRNANASDLNGTIWYKLTFENIKANCTTDSVSRNFVLPDHKAKIVGAFGFIATPITTSAANLGAWCVDTEDLSMDAVFEFTVGPRVPPGPLMGTVAKINAFLKGGNMPIDLVFGGSTVASQLCQMSTSGDVQMGKVPAKDIEAGTTSNVQTTISITNCPANVGIALTASDVATPGNTSNILTLKDASDPSVAKGVGISFSYGDDNTPITLGQAKRVIANTVEGTQPAIALKARYVKNGPGTVTAGRANAQATLTLSYQ